MLNDCFGMHLCVSYILVHRWKLCNFLFLSFYLPSILHMVLLLFQRRYVNRPIIELEAAAQEELKITELRLAKLFTSEPTVPSTVTKSPNIQSDKAAGINSFLSFLGSMESLCLFRLFVCIVLLHLPDICMQAILCSQVRTLHMVYYENRWICFDSSVSGSSARSLTITAYKILHSSDNEYVQELVIRFSHRYPFY